MRLFKKWLHRPRRADPTSEPHSKLRVTGNMKTHVGLVRTQNEDRVAYVDLPDLGSSASLLMVADGMGGHAAGEIASALAVETFTRALSQSVGTIPQRVAAGLAAANTAIFLHARETPDCNGMGTTCTALVINNGRAYLGHVGDSRAYILRGGGLRQLSIDDTVVGELVQLGRLTDDQIAEHPDRHVLLKALGVRAQLKPQVWREGLALRVADQLLLSSDGLHDLVSLSDMTAMLADNPPEQACQAMIDAALAAGGEDNISVGVFVVSDATCVVEPAARPTRRDPVDAS